MQLHIKNKIMLKKYTAINAVILYTSVFDNEKEIILEFKNGRREPNYAPGFFATEDKHLQQIIEQDNGFGVTFKLEESISIETPTLNEPTTIVEIKNRQQALAFLDKVQGVKLSILSGKDKIKAIALEHNILFPNL